jgi:hypothetical protein
MRRIPALVAASAELTGGLLMIDQRRISGYLASIESCGKKASFRIRNPNWRARRKGRLCHPAQVVSRRYQF